MLTVTQGKSRRSSAGRLTSARRVHTFHKQEQTIHSTAACREGKRKELREGGRAAICYKVLQCTQLSQRQDCAGEEMQRPSYPPGPYFNWLMSSCRYYSDVTS